jgi:hypothetical protein
MPTIPLKTRLDRRVSPLLHPSTLKYEDKLDYAASPIQLFPAFTLARASLPHYR